MGTLVIEKTTIQSLPSLTNNITLFLIDSEGVTFRKSKVLSNEFAWRFLNDKYWTNEVEIYVFK